MFKIILLCIAIKYKKLYSKKDHFMKNIKHIKIILNMIKIGIMQY